MKNGIFCLFVCFHFEEVVGEKVITMSSRIYSLPDKRRNKMKTFEKSGKLLINSQQEMRAQVPASSLV